MSRAEPQSMDIPPPPLTLELRPEVYVDFKIFLLEHVPGPPYHGTDMYIFRAPHNIS